MATFVLIPGGWHGGWAYSAVADALRSRGHTPVPVTLTGVGDRAHLAQPAVNLDTHIADVLAVIEQSDLRDVILVGHSYGGMVVSGVADRAPERVAGLVYVDAYVPNDGDSCWTLTTDAFRATFAAGASGDGYSVQPPPRLDPRATAHPLASLLQGIRLRHPMRHKRTYVFMTQWRATPFADLFEKVRNDPEWTVHTMPTSHNVLTTMPVELADLLVGTA
ncbi:alpha/beta fold hydrolase [Dactylosporangium sp. CS-033363]|uniref:alpha/beta fold hydrolase n=1 Tax=Dactylosporangium sp. CS-033363 TaxID=3239935 RepID=UPI003D8C48C3